MAANVTFRARSFRLISSCFSMSTVISKRYMLTCKQALGVNC